MNVLNKVGDGAADICRKEETRGKIGVKLTSGPDMHYSLRKAL